MGLTVKRSPMRYEVEHYMRSRFFVAVYLKRERTDKGNIVWQLGPLGKTLKFFLSLDIPFRASNVGILRGICVYERDDIVDEYAVCVSMRRHVCEYAYVLSMARAIDWHAIGQWRLSDTNDLDFVCDSLAVSFQVFFSGTKNHASCVKVQQLNWGRGRLHWYAFMHGRFYMGGYQAMDMYVHRKRHLTERY